MKEIFITDLEGITIGKHVFSRMMRCLPNIYKSRRSELSYYVPTYAALDYRDQLMSRSGYFNSMVFEPLTCYGIPIIPVPWLSHEIWLTFPLNIVPEEKDINISKSIQQPEVLVIGRNLRTSQDQ